MPIGKNSIKRVANNGYSAVKTTAPDMENSVIVTPEEKPVKTETAATAKAEKPAAKKPAAKKPSTKKPAAKSAGAKKPATKKPAAKKPAPTIPTAVETASAVTGEKDGFKGYYNIGDDMPIYLL